VRFAKSVGPLPMEMRSSLIRVKIAATGGADIEVPLSDMLNTSTTRAASLPLRNPAPRVPLSDEYEG